MRTRLERPIYSRLMYACMCVNQRRTKDWRFCPSGARSSSLCKRSGSRWQTFFTACVRAGRPASLGPLRSLAVKPKPQMCSSGRATGLPLGARLWSAGTDLWNELDGSEARTNDSEFQLACTEWLTNLRLHMWLVRSRCFDFSCKNSTHAAHNFFASETGINTIIK